jgi:hypothetical protein
MKDQFEDESVASGALTDDREFLWDVSKDTLERSGYVLDPDETSHATGVLVTRWKENLAPFRYQGKRDQITLRILPVEGGQYEIAVHVRQQRNENLESPLESIKADWEDIEPDMIRTEQILFRVKNYFRELGASSGS